MFPGTYPGDHRGNFHFCHLPQDLGLEDVTLTGSRHQARHITGLYSGAHEQGPRLLVAWHIGSGEARPCHPVLSMHSTVRCAVYTLITRTSPIDEHRWRHSITNVGSTDLADKRVLHSYASCNSTLDGTLSRGYFSRKSEL